MDLRLACGGLVVMALALAPSEGWAARGRGAKTSPAARQAELTGNLQVQPAKAVTIAHSANGRVASVLVQPGETVKLGQPLLTYQEGDVRRRLELARQRFDGLLQSAAEDTDGSIMAQMADARADLERLENEAAAMTLLAPGPGVVEKVLVSAGQRAGKQTPALEFVPADVTKRDAKIEVMLTDAQLKAFSGLRLAPKAKVRVGSEDIPATITSMERNGRDISFGVELKRAPRKDGKARLLIKLQPRDATDSARRSDDAVPSAG